MANLYKRYTAALPSTTLTTLLTVPAATAAIVRSLWFCNTTGTAVTVTASFSPNGSGTHTLVDGQSIGAGEYFDVLGTKPTGPLILEGGDVLKVSSSDTGVDVVASVLLVDRN